ncbi:glycosyltransferase family A protein [uncultured Cellulomonas sp.]|uniref:glycosyltransferase family 2 protein n=1 Tax=uncultured Cellulomonas sp. TaxID=189682 RepID=UPI0028E29CF2|nr:glycosyltransferase family A protein [uncultured Cellulomonas sp.]
MADVTCVIPTHGRDLLLAEAVASVLGQELGADVRLRGVVVSDDLGSAATEALVDRLDAAADVPVRYLDSSGPQAGTAGASRNAGTVLVQSELVAFLDDDDLWEPDFLRRTVGALEAGSHDFAVAWTHADEPRYRMARIAPGLSARDVVARNPGFVGSNFVMRTAAFRSLGGFDPVLPVSNDKDLLVRALSAGLTYAVVPELLVTNRVHGQGQLTDKTQRRLDGIRLYARKHDALLTRRDRRYLRGQAAAVRRVVGSSAPVRWWSTVAVAGHRAVGVLLGDGR